MFVEEPGKTPSKPYMLVCLDTASGLLLGTDLLLDTPTPQNFLSLIVHSMETRGVEGGAPICPESVRLANAGALALLTKELAPLDLRHELVARLDAAKRHRQATLDRQRGRGRRQAAPRPPY
jgi:hypothetical protein